MSVNSSASPVNSSTYKLVWSKVHGLDSTMPQINTDVGRCIIAFHGRLDSNHQLCRAEVLSGGVTAIFYGAWNEATCKFGDFALHGHYVLYNIAASQWDPFITFHHVDRIGNQSSYAEWDNLKEVRDEHGKSFLLLLAIVLNSKGGYMGRIIGKLVRNGDIYEDVALTKEEGGKLRIDMAQENVPSRQEMQRFEELEALLVRRLKPIEDLIQHANLQVV